MQICVANQSNEAIANDCARALIQVPQSRRSFGDGRSLLDAMQQGSISKAVALDALGRFELAAALPQVLALLEDQDPQLRLQAANLVGRLLDPAHPDGTAIDPLLRALQRAHGSPRLQQSLLVALGRTASPRASAVLLPYLSATQRPALRLAAIDACGLVAGEGTSSALLSLLDDRDAEVRLAAALALRRLGDGGTFDALWQRLTAAPAQDREAIAVALGGALRAPLPPAKLAALRQRVLASRPALRDTLLESLSFLPAERAVPLLAELGQRADAATRGKIAEVATGYGLRAAALLTRWAATKSIGEKDSNLKANVAWALGGVGEGRAGEGSVQALLTLVQDPDHAVAGNAVASLARVHPNPVALASILCGLVADSRAYVRANALTGLGLRGQRCLQGIERRLLGGDRSKSVRLAAARLLAAVPSSDAKQDRIALARCRDTQSDPEVAQACTAPASPPSQSAAADEPRTVFVLPRGGGEPLARAAFALVTPLGFIRSGWTDHRGALFERSAASLSLAVAPQFVTIE
jgi:HEAT repeat protein